MEAYRCIAAYGHTKHMYSLNVLKRYASAHISSIKIICNEQVFSWLVHVKLNSRNMILDVMPARKFIILSTKIKINKHQNHNHLSFIKAFL